MACFFLSKNSVLFLFLLFLRTGYASNDDDGSCSVFDSIATAIVATSLTACFGSDGAVSNVLEVVEEISSVDWGAVAANSTSDLISCANISCASESGDAEEEGDDDFTCVARMTCVVTELTNLEENLENVDDAFVTENTQLMSDLVTVTSNYCDCYGLLNDVPVGCASALGIGLDPEQLISIGDAACPRLARGCSAMGSFVDNCAAGSAPSAAQCAAWASIVESNSGDVDDSADAERLCALNAATIVLLPDAGMDFVQEACSSEQLSAEALSILQATRNVCTPYFDFEGDDNDDQGEGRSVVPTAWPTTMADSIDDSAANSSIPEHHHVTIGVDMSLETNAAQPSVEDEASVKTFVATQISVSEISILDFAMEGTSVLNSRKISQSQRRLKSFTYLWIATFQVRASLEEVSFASAEEWAAAVTDALTGSTIETGTLEANVAAVSSVIVEEDDATDDQIADVEAHEKDDDAAKVNTAILTPAIVMLGILLFVVVVAFLKTYQKKDGEGAEASDDEHSREEWNQNVDAEIQISTKASSTTEMVTIGHDERRQANFNVISRSSNKTKGPVEYHAVEVTNPMTFKRRDIKVDI